MNFEVSTIVMATLALPLLAACAATGCRMLAQLGGWARLSEVYAAGVMPRGRRFSFQSAIVGQISYINCLEIHTAREGVYMRLPFGLNLGHRVLLIPWADLRRQRTVSQRDSAIRCEVGIKSPIAVELPRRVLGVR
jgi:hypothetical protein